MFRLVELVIFGTMALVPMCLFALLPMILVALTIRRRAWRFAIVVLGGYLLLAGVLGVWAYAVLPAQYTRNHQWTRLPVSSSLGEQYAVAVQRADTIAARSPNEARLTREHVTRERETFRGEWLRLCAYGLALPGLALLWGWWTGWRVLPRQRAVGA
jgi:hypothetical protein